MKTGLFIPVLLVVACLASGCATNAAQALRDIEPGYSLWSGAWESTEFYLIQGTLAARIPDNLKVGQQVDIPVAISCSPFSEWRPGETSVDRCRGMLKNAGQSEGARILALTRYEGQWDLVQKYEIQFSRDMTSATGYWTGYDGNKGKFRLQKELAASSAGKTAGLPREGHDQLDSRLSARVVEGRRMTGAERLD